MWPSAAATASSLNDRKQRLMSYLKTKRDEYLQNSDDDEFFSSSRALETPAKFNDPFPGEKLTLYPAYSFIGQDGRLVLNVSGLLWLPALPNRKNRIMVAIARQIAGADQNSSDEDCPHLPSRESTLNILEREAEEYLSLHPEDSRPSSPSRGIDELAQSQSERTLRERIAPFLARAAPNREVFLSSDNGAVKTSIVSNSAGRLHKRLELAPNTQIGNTLTVRAGQSLERTTPIIFIPPQGISIISDIDDTIKKTGVTGVKREMFRNVFVRGFADLEVTGVTDWYQALLAENCMFHYVSNSPLQLYPVVKQFLESAGLPQGTIHLKQYSGFINGIMEPSSERKKPALHGLLNDFPNRKFILIGDSGESDLEAYMELATAFPENILAIYIRDITSPNEDEKSPIGDDKIGKDNDNKIRSHEDIPDLIDFRDEPPPLPPRSHSTAPARPPKPSHMRNVPRKPIEPRLAEVIVGSDVAPDSPLVEWASRVKYANRTIPAHIQFSLFKNGNDLKMASLDLVKRRSK